MYLIVYAVTFVLLSRQTIVGSSPPLCEVPEHIADIDWTRIKSIYYDVIDIPRPPTLVDCYNWHNFTPTDTGVTATLYQWTTGKLTKEIYFYDFVRDKRKTGMYLLNMDYKQAFIDTTVASVRNLATQDVNVEAVKAFADFLFSWKIFFLTDYINYFMMVSCASDGWHAYIKSSYPEVDEMYLTTIHGVLYRNNIFAQIHLKTNCMDIMKQAATRSDASLIQKYQPADCTSDINQFFVLLRSPGHVRQPIEDLANIKRLSAEKKSKDFLTGIAGGIVKITQVSDAVTFDCLSGELLNMVTGPTPEPVDFYR